MTRSVPFPSAAEFLTTAAQHLQEGRPSAALAALAGQPPGEEITLLRAACLLRLGRSQEVLALSPWPLSGPLSARTATLQARAAWQLADPRAADLARQARSQARAEGDAGALIAAAVLCAETELHQPQQALRSLAEGLKVAELTGEAADPHLLAVLAEAQARAGGHAKARRTAEKALQRSQPGSPARVLALLALGQTETARVEAQAGELADVWWTRGR